MTNKILFLDLDGTIIDYLDYHRDITIQTFKDHGVEMTREQLDQTHCLYDRITEHSLDFYKFWETYDTYDDRKIGLEKGTIRLFNDSIEFLDTFKDQTKIIVSDTPHGKADAEIGHWNLHEHFDHIYTYDHSVGAKPDPTRCLLALRKVDYKDEQLWFIGDSRSDVECGRQLGEKLNKKVYTIFINQHLTNPNADFNVKTLKEAAKIIQETD